MKIEQLKVALTHLEYFLTDVKAKEASNDINKLIELFDGCEHMTVSDFVSTAKIRLTPKETKKKPASPEINKKIIDQYVEKLHTLRSSQQPHMDLLELLQKDKQIKKPDMLKIANLFLDTQITFSTKKAAFEAIEKAFVSNSLINRNISVLEKLGWGP